MDGQTMIITIVIIRHSHSKNNNTYKIRIVYCTHNKKDIYNGWPRILPNLILYVGSLKQNKVKKSKRRHQAGKRWRSTYKHAYNIQHKRV